MSPGVDRHDSVPDGAPDATPSEAKGFSCAPSIVMDRFCGLFMETVLGVRHVNNAIK